MEIAPHYKSDIWGIFGLMQTFLNSIWKKCGPAVSSICWPQGVNLISLPPYSGGMITVFLKSDSNRKGAGKNTLALEISDVKIWMTEVCITEMLTNNCTGALPLGPPRWSFDVSSVHYNLFQIDTQHCHSGHQTPALLHACLKANTCVHVQGDKCWNVCTRWLELRFSFFPICDIFYFKIEGTT